MVITGATKKLCLAKDFFFSSKKLLHFFNKTLGSETLGLADRSQIQKSTIMLPKLSISFTVSHFSKAIPPADLEKKKSLVMIIL